MVTTTTQPYDLTYASYVDVNPRILENGMPELIPDLDSVKWCAFFNLFRCPVGARGRIFNARFGSNLYWLLQEPMDDTSVIDVQNATFGAIKQWEPRVEVDEQNSSFLIDWTLPGYRVRLALVDRITGRGAALNFNLPTQSRI